jgi:hypothetical protein
MGRWREGQCALALRRVERALAGASGWYNAAVSMGIGEKGSVRRHYGALSGRTRWRFGLV